MPKKTKTKSKEKGKKKAERVTNKRPGEESEAKDKEKNSNVSEISQENKKEAKYELIIAEKPKAAFKIASALSTTPVKKNNYLGVPYYEININGKKAVVAAGVGHLYTLLEKGGN